MAIGESQRAPAAAGLQHEAVVEHEAGRVADGQRARQSREAPRLAPRHPPGRPGVDGDQRGAVADLEGQRLLEDRGR